LKAGKLVYFSGCPGGENRYITIQPAGNPPGESIIDGRGNGRAIYDEM
jgi:hypothetical protein